MIIKSILILFILSAAQLSNAASFTVKKIKGRQAIVETAAPLEEGMTYTIESDSVALDTNAIKLPARKNSLQLGAGLQYLTGSSVQDNRMEATVRYGWNFESSEFGPTLRYQSIDQGAGVDSTIFIGGFADINFVKNQAPQNMIWGGTGSVEIGSMQFKAGGAASLLNINAGGFGTWFFAKSNTALRLQGLYGFQKISTTTIETTLSGFFSKVFLVFYF